MDHTVCHWRTVLFGLVRVLFTKAKSRSLYPNDLAHCLAHKGLFMELDYSLENDPENQATLEIKLYDDRLVFKITNLPIGPSM